MPKEDLTAKQVVHMKPTENRQEVPAGPPKGLYLVVQPTGAKSWAFRYRWHGQPRKLTIGTVADFGLAAARAQAESYVEDLEDGKDPAAVQAEEQRAAEPTSAESVAEEWLKREVERTRTKDEVRRILKRELYPSWKGKLITDIERPSLLRLLDAIVDREAPVLANRTLSILKRFFRWTEERGYIEKSPVAGVRPLSKETTRDRVLTTDELTEIWSAASTMGYPFGPWIRFLILTAQRRSEAAEMHWKHVDKANAVWTLPRESTKAGRIHDVPLSAEALELLGSLPRFKKGDAVFTTQSGEVSISGYSKAKTAIDKAINDARKKNDPKAKPISRWTYHDLRRTAATWMAQHGTPPHVLAAILNHTPGSTMGITAIYARHRYSEERRAALDSWGKFVATLPNINKETKAKSA
jgi:integrase